MKGLNVLSGTFFFFNRKALLLHTKCSVKNAAFNANMVKEVGGYRAGFWEALSDLRTCYLIRNSEFPGFCSVFYDLVFLEAFCIFWCLVVAVWFLGFGFFYYKLIIALWPWNPACLFCFDQLFLLVI